MNKLYVGLNNKIEIPKRGLFLHNEIPNISRAIIFDPNEHCFNPLKNIDHITARELANTLYTIAPQGENTLTVRNGRRNLPKALLAAKQLDEVEGDDEVQGMIDDILFSPLLRRVFCSPTNFSFKSNLILARIDRAELGDFDALVLGLFLIAHFKGQRIIPDFGFYGRNGHASLIPQNSLIAGVHTLNELPPQLRQAVLLIEDKEAHGCTIDDAEILARYANLIPGTNASNDFIADAVGA